MPEFVLPQGENEEPIAILVKMVKDGVLDPWNIDIADLTEKFLAELEARRAMSLRVSGLTVTPIIRSAASIIGFLCDTITNCVFAQISRTSWDRRSTFRPSRFESISSSA